MFITEDWTAMSTISARDPIVGFPFSNIFSVSDGTVNHSTGIPYMYLTDMEMSMQDIEV
jgi:Pyridoxamine 5'-phosphate oxidase